MAISIVMPALEMAQETGKIISWLKKEGDVDFQGRSPRRNRNRQSGAGSGSHGRRCARRRDSRRRRRGSSGQDHRVDGRTRRKAAGRSGELGSRRANHDRPGARRCCNRPLRRSHRANRSSGGQGIAQGPPNGAGIGRRSHASSRHRSRWTISGEDVEAAAKAEPAPVNVAAPSHLRPSAPSLV